MRASFEKVTSSATPGAAAATGPTLIGCAVAQPMQIAAIGTDGPAELLSRTARIHSGSRQALAGAACRRRQKKYESPQSTPVPAAQPHASGPSPTAKWAMSAEPRLMAKPA